MVKILLVLPARRIRFCLSPLILLRRFEKAIIGERPPIFCPYLLHTSKLLSFLAMYHSVLEPIYNSLYCLFKVSPTSYTFAIGSTHDFSSLPVRLIILQIFQLSGSLMLVIHDTLQLTKEKSFY